MEQKRHEDCNDEFHDVEQKGERFTCVSSNDDKTVEQEAFDLVNLPQSSVDSVDLPKTSYAINFLIHQSWKWFKMQADAVI